MADPTIPPEDRELLEQAEKARVVLARRDCAVFNGYVLRDEETGAPIHNASIHLKFHRACDQSDRTVLWAHIEAGKALGIDVPIPTPTGWTTMGALHVGDEVFDRFGRVCRVTAATPVMHGHDVYRVTFDDGGWLLADADHRWLASTMDDARAVAPKGRSGDGDPCACGCGLRARAGRRFVHNHHGRVPRSAGLRVVTTTDLLAAGLYRKGGGVDRTGRHVVQYKWRVPLASAVAYPPRALPVPPYTLGAWLGDGDSDNPSLTMHVDDRAIGDRCAAEIGGEPFWWTDPGHPNALRVRLGASRATGPRTGWLHTALRQLGVLGNKHVPEAYLTAARAQRLDLLAGLLDTDGTVNRKGTVCFDNTNERLARDVLELVRSLGFKASLRSKPAKLYGRVVGTAWTVSFTPREPVFWLARKLARQKSGPRFGRTGYRSVVAIEPVPSVPVRCIEVDSPDHSYLAGRDYTVTHNSQSISIGRSLWTLGKDHNQRICIVMASAAQAVKLVRSASKYIEESKRLRRVFPTLRPATPWTHNAITVEREVATIKDPSLQGIGVRGAVIGARVDLLVLDDILNYENTRTREQRDELRRWYYATFSGRVTRRGRIIAVGTAWHPEDLMHELAGKRGFVSYRFPVIDPETGEPTWPERWSRERIEQRRAELGETEAARQLDCRGVDEGSTRFKKEWFKACLRNGDGIDLLSSLDDVDVPEGAYCVTALDLGFSKKRRGAKTVLFTTMFYPDGQRQVLWIEAGDFSGPEVVRKVLGAVQRFKGPVFVENNGAQRLILNFALDPVYLAALREEFGPGFDPASLPVYPFQTGSNKWDSAYGVESMATELERGRWLIPNDGGGAMPDENGSSMHPEVANWIADVLAYNPNAHTGDYLMAWWICREGGRSVAAFAAKRRKGNGVRVLRARSADELARERAAKIEAEERAAEAARIEADTAEAPPVTK